MHGLGAGGWTDETVSMGRGVEDPRKLNVVCKLNTRNDQNRWICNSLQVLHAVYVREATGIKCLEFDFSNCNSSHPTPANTDGHARESAREARLYGESGTAKQKLSSLYERTQYRIHLEGC